LLAAAPEAKAKNQVLKKEGLFVLACWGGKAESLPATKKSPERSDSLSCLLRAVAGRLSEATERRGCSALLLLLLPVASDLESSLASSRERGRLVANRLEIRRR
jgi:hypothetical protein